MYYYYDDDDDSKVLPLSLSTNPKKKIQKTLIQITNAHDGPARNTISRTDKTREKATPEVNEVLPSRGKTRSRQLGEEDAVQEERLPSNTRFALIFLLAKTNCQVPKVLTVLTLNVTLPILNKRTDSLTILDSHLEAGT